MNTQWNERYAAEGYFYVKEPNVFFKDEINNLEPGKLLLPAEGEGRTAVYAAKLGWDVTCLDWSEEGKKKADTFAAEAGVKIDYQVAELSSFEYGEEEYDCLLYTSRCV